MQPPNHPTTLPLLLPTTLQVRFGPAAAPAGRLRRLSLWSQAGSPGERSGEEWGTAFPLGGRASVVHASCGSPTPTHLPTQPPTPLSSTHPACQVDGSHISGSLPLELPPYPYPLPPPLTRIFNQQVDGGLLLELSPLPTAHPPPFIICLALSQVDARIDGGLLLELYSRDGVGTMISTDFYEGIRRASITVSIRWAHAGRRGLENMGETHAPHQLHSWLQARPVLLTGPGLHPGEMLRRVSDFPRNPRLPHRLLTAHSLSSLPIDQCRTWPRSRSCCGRWRSGEYW